MASWREMKPLKPRKPPTRKNGSQIFAGPGPYRCNHRFFFERNNVEASLHTRKWWFWGLELWHGIVYELFYKWNDIYISGRKTMGDAMDLHFETSAFWSSYSPFLMSIILSIPQVVSQYFDVSPVSCSGFLPFVNLVPKTNHQLYCYKSSQPPNWPNFALRETTQVWLVWYVFIKSYSNRIHNQPLFLTENAGAVVGWLVIALQSKWSTNSHCLHSHKLTILRFSKGYLVLQLQGNEHGIWRWFSQKWWKISSFSGRWKSLNQVTSKYGGQPPQPTYCNRSIFRGLPNWTYPSLTAIWNEPPPTNSHGNTLWDHCTAWNSERKPLCATRVLRSMQSVIGINGNRNCCIEYSLGPGCPRSQ